MTSNGTNGNLHSLWNQWWQEGHALPWPKSFGPAKNIIIHGLGVTGESALKVAMACPLEKIIVVNAGVHFKEHAKKMASSYKGHIEFLSEEEAESLFSENWERTFIIKAAGIDPRQSFSRGLKKMAQKFSTCILMNDIEWSYLWLKSLSVLRGTPLNIFAITGTNGKTTTTTLCEEMLKQLCEKKEDFFVGGNIGISPLDLFLQETFSLPRYLALEMSSFQWEGVIHFAPDANLVTNVSENHGERYDHYHRYIEAKALSLQKTALSGGRNIDTVFCPWSEVYSEHEVKLWHSKRLQENDLSLTTEESSYQPRVWTNVNQQNILMCRELLAGHFGKEELQRAFQATLKSFSGVKYRCQYLGESKEQGVHFYNDAKSTNFLATEVAIRSIAAQHPEEALFVIFGGQLRRGEHTDVSEYLKAWSSSGMFSKVDKVFVIGECASFLEKHKEQLAGASVEFAHSLQKVLFAIKRNGQSGSQRQTNILLSPGHPSFDQFKNYEERGASWTTLVQQEFFKE
jgi:UDP-N-acetylmuramoylalanine--D-glutamate ligase